MVLKSKSLMKSNIATTHYNFDSVKIKIRHGPNKILVNFMYFILKLYLLSKLFYFICGFLIKFIG